MTSFDPSKVQGKIIHLIQLAQEFKLHLLRMKSKTIFCSEYSVLNKAHSGWLRTGENKLHAACFESDRLNTQRCCTPTTPIEVSIAKSFSTKCLASSSFRGLDLSFYFRESVLVMLALILLKGRQAPFKPEGLNTECFSVLWYMQNKDDNTCGMLWG